MTCWYIKSGVPHEIFTLALSPSETSATGNPEQQYNPWSNQSNPWSDPGCTSGSIGELEKLASGDGHHGTHSKKQGVQVERVCIGQQ